MPTPTIIDLPDVLTEDIQLSVPLQFRRGSLRDDEKKSIESAIRNVKGIATRTGLTDWRNLKILDFGCGVKVAQTLVQCNIGVDAYVGMDVHRGIIEFLNEHVTRPNFDFYSVPFQNDMYNKDGQPLTATSDLPGNIKKYDLVILQSVFTHFSPVDFSALLHVLRRYAQDDARMLFTCFIDNEMKDDFLDADPERPLLRAFYKEVFIRKMLEEAKWNPLSLNPPGFAMQSHFVCKPC